MLKFYTFGLIFAVKEEVLAKCCQNSIYFEFSLGDFDEHNVCTKVFIVSAAWSKKLGFDRLLSVWYYMYFLFCLHILMQ